jgi:ABC-type iron transport system FetAB ATPase subunit
MHNPSLGNTLGTVTLDKNRALYATEPKMTQKELGGSMQPDKKRNDVELTIRNCNSIDAATISLRPGALNIKYGPNGLGKSTIARALTLNAESNRDLKELTPFKYRNLEECPTPEVSGAESITSVMTFNDEYVSQFVFRKDEVLENSFEIFINTDEYKAGLREIESIFEALKNTFAEQDEFNEAVRNFEELHEVFSVTSAGKVAKNSKGAKALSLGGKLEEIPNQLEGYKSFLQSADPAGWISWQAKGKAFLELSDNCPFCSSESLDKSTAIQVSAEYNSTSVKHLSHLRGVIDRLGKYIEPGNLEKLEQLTRSIGDITPEQESFLVSLQEQISTLLQKLTSIRQLSFHALRDETDVAGTLRDLRIDLTWMSALQSDASKVVVESINEDLQIVEEKIIDIRKKISRQKRTVSSLIQKNQRAINDFLNSAGYKYAVRVNAEGDSYRMLLEHKDLPGHLEAAASHLSYGERNAFALVLFMHHVRRESPDLVVLDDPVSSFDKTKKFAILHQLFHGKNSISDVTSLLLTHDIEPAIDIVRTAPASEPAVHFLLSRDGIVSERPIEEADIQTFSQVCEENIKSASDLVIKCIYLRRLLEVHGSREGGYELLSNLLHVREEPVWKGSGKADEPMTSSEVAAATASIRMHIPEFDYSQLIRLLSEPENLKARFDATDVGYEKVQLVRVMTELGVVSFEGDKVFSKFVKESYHIENEYVMQLNPQHFDAVPDHIIASCEALIERAESGRPSTVDG